MENFASWDKSQLSTLNSSERARLVHYVTGTLEKLDKENEREAEEFKEEIHLFELKNGLNVRDPRKLKEPLYRERKQAEIEEQRRMGLSEATSRPSSRCSIAAATRAISRASNYNGRLPKRFDTEVAGINQAHERKMRNAFEVPGEPSPFPPTFVDEIMRRVQTADGARSRKEVVEMLQSRPRTVTPVTRLDRALAPLHRPPIHRPSQNTDYSLALRQKRDFAETNLAARKIERRLVERTWDLKRASQKREQKEYMSVVQERRLRQRKALRDRHEKTVSECEKLQQPFYRDRLRKSRLPKSSTHVPVTDSTVQAEADMALAALDRFSIKMRLIDSDEETDTLNRKLKIEENM
eukprot:Rmarinus@m.23261